MLNRSLATANHFPHVDVLESVSRLVRDLCSDQEIQSISEARDLLAFLSENEDLINIGAYKQGTNSKLDKAIAKHDVIMNFYVNALMRV